MFRPGDLIEFTGVYRNWKRGSAVTFVRYTDGGSALYFTDGTKERHYAYAHRFQAVAVVDECAAFFV